MSDAAALHFDQDYREEALLRDGTRVHLRLVRPEDKPMLRAGFERLSPASRYRRFFTNKNSLTERELVYLTEVDNRDHLAIGAARFGADGREEGLGVARMIRLPDHPNVAESAIAVIDEVHNRGLGSLLLARLVAAARERGIDSFESVVLGSNAPMLELLRNKSDHIESSVSDGVVTVRLALPELGPEHAQARPPRHSAAYTMFVMAAKGLLELQKLFPWRRASGVDADTESTGEPGAAPPAADDPTGTSSK